MTTTKLTALLRYDADSGCWYCCDPIDGAPILTEDHRTYTYVRHATRNLAIAWAADRNLSLVDEYLEPIATEPATKPSTYTVGVGRNWYERTGHPAPDRTCGHRHRTLEAAQRCGTKLYASHYDRNGNWSACVTWHGWYVIDNSTGAKAE